MSIAGYKYFHIIIVVIYIILPFILLAICLLVYNILNVIVVNNVEIPGPVINFDGDSANKLIENFLETKEILTVNDDDNINIITIDDLKDDICNICIEEYEVNQKVTFMCCEKRTSSFTTDNPLSHKFHTECLKKHIMVSYNSAYTRNTKQYIYKCPLCRTPIII